MVRLRHLLAVILAAFGLASSASDLAAAQYQVLHSFSGAPADGSRPGGVLDTDGTTLYGASELGGATTGFGAIYGIQADGSDFHLIASMPSNGAVAIRPLGGVAVVGSTLYGTTYDGGIGQFGGNGTVFAVNTDGSDLHVVHQFANSEGSKPDSAVFRSGSTVYGAVPKQVNDNNFGSVFSVGGGGYVNLHLFSGGSDGTRPTNVSVIGTSVYGSNSSFIFKMNLNGTGFQVLGAPAAAGPLMAVGTTLFGVQSNQLSNRLFSMDADGTNVQTLHSFVGGASDGAAPLGNLTYFEGFLYGISSQGGASNLGTVWRIKPDGTGFEVVHSFLGGAGDGASPVGGLTLIGSTLFGQTYSGGASNVGTIFALAVPEPSSVVVAGMGVVTLAIAAARRARKD